MKNIPTVDSVDNAVATQTSDSLLKSKRGHSHDRNEINANMGHKGRSHHRSLLRNGVTYESRSQSLPNCSDDKIKAGAANDSCDMKLLAESDSPPESPTQELWFNTWPERCEKHKALESQENNTLSKPTSSSKMCDSDRFEQQTQPATKNTFTLNEALESISLAYSPVTKQLHYVQKPEVDNVEEEEVKVKLGHRRTEAGSFSSTVSSLSEPSPSGSLLDADERIPSPCDDSRPKKKGLSGFLNRNLFAWRSAPSTPVNNNGWRIFGPKVDEEVSGLANSPKHESIIASSSALIQHLRPANLPAKDYEEEQRHRDEYKAMIAAAKKREAKNSAAKQKQQRMQLLIEEQLATATKYWNFQVLPKWDSMYNTKKTRDLWWQGLPSSVRGRIWQLAIGNELNITYQLYEICVLRAQSRLNKSEASAISDSDLDQESSMDVIKLDIARTFPSLCIFQEGGPYSEILHSLLAAYVCYRPDVGYVQGMSFIAAVLILNMEQFEAFVCFSNLLNRPLHLAAFTLNQLQMKAYYSAYNQIFNYNLPKLFGHFEKSGLTPDLYLLDWVYTVFSKAMPLDVACRVWDVFLRDGDEFIFRTALGVLHLHQEVLLKMDFLHGAQFLTRLPDDLSADSLFRSIQSINVSVGKQTFSQIVDKCLKEECC